MFSSLRSGVAAVVGLAVLGLAACASTVVIAPTYAPATSAAPTPRGAGPATCRVRLAAIEDLRGDAQAAGVFATRAIHAGDAPAWLRSGLLSPARDPRLAVSDQTPPEAADLTIRVEFLKMYMLAINTSDSANVVVRVHYADPGAAPDDQVYRGVDTSMELTGLDAEVRGAFDDALSKLLSDLDRDLLTRCAAKAAAGR